MKRILGLDLGTNSIGWALVEKDEKKKEIIGMGSRIDPLSPDDKDEFSKGNTISKNHRRTVKRTQRKLYDRYQLRRNALIEELKNKNMMPDEDLIHVSKFRLWELRSKAVETKLTLPEIGRILLHLNQKRGYKSARSEENLDKKDTEYVEKVKNRHEELRDAGLTIGQYLLKELKKSENFRTKDLVYPREAYIEEFDRIISIQKGYYPEELSEDFIQRIRNEIIFYQRALKSQKGLVSICEFEGFWMEKEGKNLYVGPKVAPKSSPLFQIEKIWETINNIRLKDKYGQPIVLGIREKEKLFKVLNIPGAGSEDFDNFSKYSLDRNGKLSYSKLLNLLGLSKDDVYANKQLENGIQGNILRQKILNCFNNPDEFSELLRFDISFIKTDKKVHLYDRKTGEVIHEEKESIIANKAEDIEKEPLYRLWHVLYSIKDREECENILKKKFNIPPDSAEKLSALDFTLMAFGNKSVRAIRRILPYLAEGYDYSESCMLAGYNHSNSLTKDQNRDRQIAERLSLLEKNSLRQPVVEKILNQMINLVNAVIEEYGHPDEIRIELARELKQSRQERFDADKAIRKIERDNQSIRKELVENYALRASRNNVIKWRLYHEMNNQKLNAICVYCGQPISFTDAIKGNDVDIEHIIPKAKLFDDSQSNKTLSHRSCNRQKDKQTAFDYMKTKKEDEFHEYIKRVNYLYKNRLIGKAKRDKLLMSEDKIPQDFIQRQLRESQYIARKSREILMEVCHDVWTTSGTVTAELRHIWGWDDVLMNLQMPKYKKYDLTEEIEFENNGQKHKKERITDWNKRNDHRHHAIDALTVACTEQGFIQRLNTLNSGKTRNEMLRAINEFQKNASEVDNKRSEFEIEKRKLYQDYLFVNKPFSTNEVEQAASKIMISFKPGKKVATWGKRKVKRNGRKVTVQSDILVPRGALSEEQVYGRIKVLKRENPVKFLFHNPHLIVKERIRKKVQKRLSEYDDNPDKALKSLENEPIYIKDDILLEWASCYSEEYVYKYKVDVDFKKADKIIDDRVREIVKQRLSEFDNNPKEAFKDLDGNPIWFNEEKNIPIKSVRCFTGLSSIEPLKKNANNEVTGFVKPGNNHHIALYLDENGKLQEHICTFWHAVERKKYDIPVIIKNTDEIWEKVLSEGEDYFPDDFLEKLPDIKWQFVTSLQQNEMFLLGLPEENVRQINVNQKDNYSFLSDYLYRVQKITSGDYVFRHHLETQIVDTTDSKLCKRWYRVQSLKAFAGLNPVKIRVDVLGRMVWYQKCF